MVLKKSKFGGNTGNTLRRSGGCKVHPNWAYISKETRSLSSTLLAVEDKERWLKSGLTTEMNDHSRNTSRNVKYSLNKDKRWLLPSQLKLELEKDKHIEQTFFSNEKGEEKREKKRKKKRGAEHQRPLPRETVAITERLCKWSDRLPYRNQLYSFINSAEPEHNRNSNSWRGPLNLPHDLPSTMDVTYTIETAERSGVVWPNYTKHRRRYKNSDRWEGKPNHYDGASVYEYVFKNNRKRRPILKKEYHDVISENEFDVLPENHLDKDVQQVAPPSSRGNDLLKLDVFVKRNSNKEKNVCGRKFDRDTTKGDKDIGHGKGDYIIINIPEGLIFPVLTDISKLQGKNKGKKSKYEGRSRKEQDITYERPLKHTSGNYSRGSGLPVASSSISNHNLRKKFGKRHIEAMCTPRRFVIFNHQFDREDSLLTVHVLEERQDFSIVDVTVNNVLEKFDSCLQRIFDQELLDFNYLTNSCFSGHVEISCEEYIPPLVQENCVEEVYKPLVMTTSINKICRDLFTINPNDCESIENHNEVNSDLTFCNICLSKGSNNTSLNECKHTACDECWSRFSNTRVVSLNSSKVPCFEPTCKQMLHPATVVTFLNPKLISTYIKTYCETHVFEAENLKFCEFPRCGAIAVSHNSNASQDNTEITRQPLTASNSAVVCRCNRCWCLGCGKEDHWPSSCFENEKYLRKYNWEQLFDRYGHLIRYNCVYKPCPRCKVFINKDGGCDNMICRCGFHFQWTYTYERVKEFTALDGLRGLSSFETRWQRQAIHFQSNYTDAKTLRTNLKADKNISWSSRRSLVSKALSTLISGFKLLENLSVAAASCASRHKRGRILKFVHTFKLVLGVLDTGLHVMDVNTIKVAKLRLDLDNVEKSLNNLVYIGVQKLK